MSNFGPDSICLLPELDKSDDVEQDGGELDEEDP